MTLREARKRGWAIHEGRKPELVPCEGGYRVERGSLSAEKTQQRPNGFAITRRVEVETAELDGWEDLQGKLLAEIEKVETA